MSRASFSVRYGGYGLRAGSSSVAKEDEYVINGLDTLRLAERAATSRDKLRLLKLADSWLELAERIRRRGNCPPRRKLPEHPLVKATFGRERRRG
jgi:hypothetical protein